jgi:hypothetical protein
MQKIYCCITNKIPSVSGSEDVIVTAVVEKDGKLYDLACHLSSTVKFAKHDIGLTSDWKHDLYKKAFPEGYELEWVDNIASHPVLGKYLKVRAT